MVGSLAGLFLGMGVLGSILSWNTAHGLFLAFGTTAEVLLENGRLVWGALWVAGNVL